MKSPLQNLLKETLGVARKGLYTVVVFSFCINLLMLAVPIYMLQIFDRVLSSHSIDTLILLSVIIIFAISTLASLEAIRNHIMVRIGLWIERRLAGTVLMGSISLPLKSGKNPSTQGLRDLVTFRSFLSGSEIYPFLDSPWVPIFLIFVSLLHPYLGVISLVGSIALFALALLNEYGTRSLLTIASRANIKAMQRAESAVRNADVIEAMGMMPNLIAQWNRVNSENLTNQENASYRSGIIIAISKFVRLVLQVAMMGTGAWLVIRGELTPGGMIAASILLGRALSPVEQAIGAWKSSIAARNAYERLKKQLEITPPRGKSMSLPEPKGDIFVEDLSYIHPGQTEPILKEINFKLNAGESLGLVGPSGAGKTTLARLLLGNLSPQIGQARLDGMDVSQWEPDDMGQNCGYLPQDIELFSGTVMENIARMGEGDPTLIVNTALLAGCHDMILRLPNGYDTFVGESGAALSGGERQQIGLARALYGNPRLVILDEPNANLDAVGEDALLNALTNLKEKGITVITISHRQNIIQNVDKILILNLGQIQDFGSRNEVMTRINEKSRKGNVTKIQRHG